MVPAIENESFPPMSRSVHRIARMSRIWYSGLLASWPVFIMTEKRWPCGLRLSASGEAHILRPTPGKHQ